MSTINLTFHITGPAWAWWVLCASVVAFVIAYALRTALHALVLREIAGQAKGLQSLRKQRDKGVIEPWGR